jgi:biopolymer transport protein ExbB/TolQ
MNDAQLLTIACSLVATLFGILVAIIAWGGSRVISKLEDVANKLNSMAVELHGRINDIDVRVSVIETKCDSHHK